MIAKLINGCPVPCPKNGADGSGNYHTNLPLFYARHLDVAAEDGYYPVQYTDKPEGDYLPSWELQEVEGVTMIVQLWTPYTPQPEPEDPIAARLDYQDAKIDYIAMMTDVDMDDMEGIA